MNELTLFRLDAVRYGYGRADVIKGLTLDLPAGGVIALVAANGAGKSTLLGLLGLLHEGRLRGGTITYRPGQAGEYRYGQGGAAEFRRRTFGFIPQKSDLLPFLTVGENIGLSLRLGGWPREEAEQRVEALWRGFGHDPALLRQYPTSGGQARLAVVLRALAHGPDVLFADEPFNDLDLLSRPKVVELLGGWLRHENNAPPRTLILVSHDLNHLVESKLKDDRPFVDYFVGIACGQAIPGPEGVTPPLTHLQVQAASQQKHKGKPSEFLLEWLRM